MNPQPHLYVIVVHHGHKKVTQQTVTAWLKNTTPPREIIVVDNSRNYEPIQNETVVRAGANSGYAGGLNIGLGTLFTRRPDNTDLVICCNNDLLPLSSTLERILKWYSQHNKTVVLGYRRGWFSILSGRSHLAPLPRRSQSVTGRSSYLHGALFVLPWATFNSLKKLPDTYFLYWEDVLISQRLRRLGHELHIIPDLVSHHDDERNPSPDQIFYLVRNGARFMQEEIFPPARLYWRLWNRLRLWYHCLMRHRLICGALRDAFLSKNGPRPL